MAIDCTVEKQISDLLRGSFKVDNLDDRKLL